MIDLDAITSEYKSASEYWQTQWNAVIQAAKDRENELKNQLMLAQWQFDAERNARIAKAESLECDNRAMEDLIARIQGALNTEETGDALVTVASEANRAEMELAALERKALSDD